LFFQAISERYERNQSVILTSNKAFSDRGQVFAGDAIMASAALDRLLHRSRVIHVRGDSYRLRQKHMAAESAAGAFALAVK
jgi:DNA replication protein DnaC